MKKNHSPLHRRRTIRLKSYDYTREGAYFITICTQEKDLLFGNVPDGVMRLNNAGEMISTVWLDLPRRFSSIILDEYIIMPNHIHGIIILKPSQRPGESCIRPESFHENNPNQGDHKDRPYGKHYGKQYGKYDGESGVMPSGTMSGSLGRIIQAFKSISTHEYILGIRQRNWKPFIGRLWQRNYYEHVIRDENNLNRVQKYIINNPLRWLSDGEKFDEA
jgi:REP element-mobilizing transposase RayT